MIRPPRWCDDLAALVGRAGIGLVWVAHGWGKIQDPGQVAQEFTKMGVLLPTISAWYSSIVEFVVAIALMVGFGLPLAGILLLVDALGAVYFGSGIGGFVHGDSDAQLAFVLGMGSLIAGFHGGRYSVDRLLGSRGAGTEIGSDVG